MTSRVLTWDLLRVGALVLVLAVTAVLPARQAAGASFVVNSTGDEPDAAGADLVCDTALGTCTLRAAIQQANFTAGPDAISFAIGSGPQTISPATPLPAITDSVSIDGTTQPGFAGAPIIELSGVAAGAGANGLEAQADDTTIRGLVVNRFANNGIRINGASDVTIAGNYIGTVLSGTAAAGNLWGVAVETATVVDNVLIGGTVAADRNVVSGNVNGIAMGNGTNHRVQGNFIGTDASGTAAVPNSGGFPNGAGIIAGPSTLIGGAAPGARNVISGNSYGVLIAGGGSAPIIQGNFIGTKVDGVSALANGYGIRAIGGSGALIGGTGPGEANVIAFNTGDGVQISIASSVRVSRNSIHSNSDLGIDLGASGVLANDLDDPDGGPNGGQNYPVITFAASDGVSTTVGVSLNSTPSTTFDLEFFSGPICDDSFHGEGRDFAGTASLTTDAGGDFTTTVALTNFPTGTVITATATGPSGATSEFSRCGQVNCAGTPGIWVVGPGDSDCDGFTNANEAQIGTDPSLDCHLDSTAHNEALPDRWPVDFNDDRRANTIDVGSYVPRLGAVSGVDPEYAIRFDLTFNGIINVIDVGRFVAFLGKSCTL